MTLRPLVLCLLIGCGADGVPRDASVEPPSRSPAASTDSPAAPATAAAASTTFDPGSLQVGDTVDGLTVAAMNVHRVFEDSVWSGTVRFSGRLELRGVYQPHFDYPEPDELCFHVDSTSAADVPRFAPDSWTAPGSKTWFCFTNPARAAELLGDPVTPREAVIVVDDYTVARQFTDAYSTARLIEVREIGAATRHTLRDPR